MGNQSTDSGLDGAELGIWTLVMPGSQFTLSRTEAEIQNVSQLWKTILSSIIAYFNHEEVVCVFLNQTKFESSMCLVISKMISTGVICSGVLKKSMTEFIETYFHDDLLAREHRPLGILATPCACLGMFFRGIIGWEKMHLAELVKERTTFVDWKQETVFYTASFSSQLILLKLMGK